ncbi:MAG TPA: TetR/AcrR family transcriptional regulator [Nitrospinota bacterium]|nr:TetR/AcrR family transcriptional regulator [Nitrospinota bacterium]
MKHFKKKSDIQISKRREIFQAAEKIFAEKGFQNTTVDEIAKIANIGKGTVYIYFKNKLELFLSLIEERVENIFSITSKVLTEKRDFLKRLENLVNAQFAFYQENEDFFKIFSSERSRFFAEVKIELKKEIIKKYQSHIDLIAKFIQEGVDKNILKNLDSKMVSVSLAGLIHAFMLQWIMIGETYNLVDNTSFVVNLFLEGVKK